MSKEKDTIVEALFAELQKQKAAIAKTEKPNWLTNCSFSFTRNGSDRTNIQTVSDVEILVEMLTALLEKADAYEKAKKVMGTTGTFQWQGFTVEEWTADFQTRKNKIEVTKLKTKQTDLEARINKLVSPEKREAMEIEALKKEMGMTA